MVLRTRLELPEDLFPVDPWGIEGRVYTGEFVQEAETIFALANGSLGLRGSHEENHPAVEAGTYLNGFYELRPITYGEKAYGFPDTGQTMLNCPDGKILKLYVDDEPFDVDTREIADYRRRLDLARGLKTRELTWLHPNGKRIRYRTSRLVSFTNRHLAAIQVEITVEGDAASVIVASELGRKAPMTESRDPEDPRLGTRLGEQALRPLGVGEGDGCRAVLSFGTQLSGGRMACGMDHAVECEDPWEVRVERGEEGAQAVFRIDAEGDRTIRLTKFLAYHHSRHRGADELRRQVGWTLDSAKRCGFGELAAR